MNDVRNDHATFAVVEALEPRLLLSTSGLAGPEAFESAGIPAYIDVDFPDPDHKQIGRAHV